MGVLDTSGYGGGPAEWLRDFAEIEERVARSGTVAEDPRSNFWQASSGNHRLAFDATLSDVWSTAGRRRNLVTTYDQLGHSMPRLLAAVLELGAGK